MLFYKVVANQRVASLALFIAIGEIWLRRVGRVATNGKARPMPSM